MLEYAWGQGETQWSQRMLKGKFKCLHITGKLGKILGVVFIDNQKTSELEGQRKGKRAKQEFLCV